MVVAVLVHGKKVAQVRPVVMVLTES